MKFTFDVKRFAKGQQQQINQNLFMEDLKKQFKIFKTSLNNIMKFPYCFIFFIFIVSREI